MSDDPDTKDDVAENDIGDALCEFVHPPNRLRAKVGEEGLSIDEDVLAKAEEAVKALSKEFSSRAAEEVAQLKKAYQDAKKDAANREQHMEQLFHYAHDIHGEGGSFGYPLISRIAKSLCWFLEGLNQPTDDDFFVIKAHVDTLAVIVASGIKGHGGEVGTLVAEGLEVVVAKRKSHDGGALDFDLEDFLTRLAKAGT